MPRKSNLRIAAESALANLETIHELAVEGERLDGSGHAIYLHHAADCRRWCAALKAAGMDYPRFMSETSGLAYFGHVWGLPKVFT